MKYHRTVFNANFRYANVWKTTITLRRRPSVNCEYALSLIIELSLNFHKKFVLMENISQSKVSKCEKCRSCLMDSSNILADISHPLENRLDPMLHRVQERVRELELELAQTKLAHVEAECRNQVTIRSLYRARVSLGGRVVNPTSFIGLDASAARNCFRTCCKKQLAVAQQNAVKHKRSGEQEGGNGPFSDEGFKKRERTGRGDASLFTFP